MDSETIKSFFALIGPFIGGLAGAFWGMKKYKNEKSWDEKRSIYKKIIITLSNMDQLVKVDPESGGSWSQGDCDSIYSQLAVLRESSAESVFFTVSDISNILNGLSKTIEDCLVGIHEAPITSDHPEESLLPKIRLAIKEARQKIISIGKADLNNYSLSKRFKATINRM